MYRVILCFVLLTISLTASAQASATSGNGSGIFLTEQDFVKNNITLFAMNDAANHLDVVLGDVVLTRGGKSNKLSKGSFFGYYQDGVRYRYYRNGQRIFPSKAYYKILEDSGIVIYSRIATAYKRKPRTWYYYSDNTLSAIRKVSEKKFHELSDRVQARMKKYFDVTRSEG
jgi:hypothetical protein